MAEFPFEIPQSLATYAEQFDDDPLSVTAKLKKQLQKRGPDAVGYFLLAWFYHLKGINDQAIEFAIKGKTYAPGSPLMEKLHYYLSHPDTLEAWTPDIESGSLSSRHQTPNGPEPVLNLDNLINRLSKVNSKPISIDSPDTEKESSGDTSIKVDEVEDIASETLAKIHEMQGKTKAAIRIYERLKTINKDKEKYYEEQINRLESGKGKGESGT